MGKKVFSLCMALALCLSLLPDTALAAAPPENQVLSVGGVLISSTGYWTTDSNGNVTEYTGEGTPTDNYIHYDVAKNTLTLHNATIKESVSTDTSTLIAGTAIGVLNQNGAAELTITLAGTNTIAEVSMGICVLAFSDSTGDASLTITGTGSLTAEGRGYGNHSGIMVQSNGGKAELTINNVDVTATNTSDNQQGILLQSANSSPATLTVNGGELTASGQSAGIKYFIGSGESGSGTPSLTVSNNAIVRASGGISDNSSTDIKIGVGDNSSGGIVFDGKDGTVYGNMTLQEDLEIGEGESLTIGKDASLTVPGGTTLTNNGTIVNTGGALNGEPGGTGKIETTPTIDTQPASQTVTAGETAQFSVTATGENLSYQWQQNATDSGSGWTNVGSSTSSNTYTIDNTKTSMSGYQYRCVVSNSAGTATSNAATLTVNAATVPVTGVKLDKTSLTLQETGSDTLTATVEPADATNKDVTWASSNSAVATVDATGNVKAVGAGKATITVTTADGSHTATCAVTVEKPYTPPPYIPPTKTPSEQAIDKIEDAKEGSTVKITLRTGQTKLDKEVFEELAGRDVTLEISLPGGVTWTVNGEDIPQTADLTDLDMGVSLNTSTIPVDLINAITGEIGTVQLTLKHDGPFGFTMTLTAPVGKENEGLWANLYHYDEDAEEMVYQTAAQVDEDGNVALPFDHASQYALVLDSKSHDLPFTDLAANAWYTDAVAYVYRHDIMEGMSATTFQPNGTLSRAMAVQIFYNLEGQPDISDENLGYPYEDVDAQAWYGDAVYWARITGVATGYGDGTFQPGDSITRQEFAQMLYNYAKYKGYDLTAAGDLSQFPDSGSVADWAKVAMSWANGNKLINGHDNGTIDAAGTATRAQAASILMRFDQNLAEK